MASAPADRRHQIAGLPRGFGLLALAGWQSAWQRGSPGPSCGTPLARGVPGVQSLAPRHGVACEEEEVLVADNDSVVVAPSGGVNTGGWRR